MLINTPVIQTMGQTICGHLSTTNRSLIAASSADYFTEAVCKNSKAITLQFRGVRMTSRNLIADGLQKLVFKCVCVWEALCSYAAITKTTVSVSLSVL